MACSTREGLPVLRAKRNDLCPCGSGKVQELLLACRPNRRFARVNTSSGEALLLTELYQFAQLPRFNGAVCRLWPLLGRRL